jgi:hypothetical protein
MDTPSRRRFRREHAVAIALIVVLVAAFVFWMRGDRSPAAGVSAPAEATAPATMAAVPAAPSTTAPAVPTTGLPRVEPTAPTEPYDVAHMRVEEDRAEAMGLAARVSVPDELKHYSDRRRFLAVQMASAHQQQYELPQDEADLAAMLRAGQLVELPLMTSDFILYDIGNDAGADPMEAYDPDARKSIPLFASPEELDQEMARLDERVHNAGSRREKVLADSRHRLLATYYGDPSKREVLLRKGAEVAALAADFGGKAYDLRNPLERAQFDSRLLHLVRPRAREVILELAREYRERFGRQLPVTSLIRSERYQRGLSRVNANATKVEFPPHSTGCAFDISYRYMAADEQQLLLDRVAQLEREGRVEALRERRNHIHVFVFEDQGAPPDSLVAQYLDEVDASHGITRRASQGGARGARGARAR